MHSILGRIIMHPYNISNQEKLLGEENIEYIYIYIRYKIKMIPCDTQKDFFQKRNMKYKEQIGQRQQGENNPILTNILSNLNML